MKKMMIQNASFVPGFSGGYVLPSFSDLTASKQASKGLLQNLIVLQPPFSHIYKTLSAFHFALLFVFS